MWAGRLAWLGHLLDVQKVAGPNPVRPTTKPHFQIINYYLSIVCLMAVRFVVVGDFQTSLRY